jgi:hypothetical protein
MFMSRGKVEAIKNNYPKGTRVELNYMDDPYAKLKKGDQGNVMFVDDAGTVHIQWDSGSTLGVIPGVDSFSVVPEQKQDISDPEISM